MGTSVIVAGVTTLHIRNKSITVMLVRNSFTRNLPPAGAIATSAQALNVS